MYKRQRKTLVSVERISDKSLLDDPATAAGTIPAMYIEEVRVIEQGAHPVGLFTEYESSQQELKDYVQRARDPLLFQEWLTETRSKPA